MPEVIRPKLGCSGRNQVGNLWVFSGHGEGCVLIHSCLDLWTVKTNSSISS